MSVGDGLPVTVIGVLNVSPESFYPGSVHTDPDDLLGEAERMVEAGAQILDVGALSTAPYLQTEINEEEETDRLGRAVERLVGKLGVPISADTSRSAPARAALAAGATIINDVSGLTGDPEMGELVARTGAGLILMASPLGQRRIPKADSPVSIVAGLLGESLAIACSRGVALERVVIDPGIGFFREAEWPWFEWDCQVLARLGEFRELGRPICAGVSRKSFIGALLGQDDPEDRLLGSLAATSVAVVKGAHLIRTHDVAETIQAIRVAQAIRQFQP
jgi:dihydropteroate synthase